MSDRLLRLKEIIARCPDLETRKRELSNWREKRAFISPSHPNFPKGPPPTQKHDAECENFIEQAQIEDFPEDNFTPVYEDPINNYRAAFVRAAIWEAEGRRRILAPIKDLVDTDPEVLKRRAGHIPIMEVYNQYFGLTRDANEIGIGLIGREPEKYIPLLNETLEQYGSELLPTNAPKEELFVVILDLQREAAINAFEAELVGEYLYKVMEKHRPKFQKIEVSRLYKALPWLPQSIESMRNFKLTHGQEIELREVLASMGIEENDLAFLTINNQEGMVYFMDAALGDNYRISSQRAILFPHHFYEFIARIGLTRYQTERLYRLPRVIRAEVGYWPPEARKQRL